MCVSINRAVRKGREASQWSWQNNMQSVASCQGSVWKLCVLCVRVCLPSGTDSVSVCMPLSGKLCSLVHAAALSKFSVLVKHWDRESLSSRRHRVLSEPGMWAERMAWSGDGWKIPPDCKTDFKSRPLYSKQERLGANLQNFKGYTLVRTLAYHRVSLQTACQQHWEPESIKVEWVRTDVRTTICFKRNLVNFTQTHHRSRSHQSSQQTGVALSLPH